MNATQMAARSIAPLHGVRDEEKLATLVESMRRDGWVGEPVLVVEGCGWTGSHRVAAAQLAGIDVVAYDWILTDAEREAFASAHHLTDGRPRDQDSTLLDIEMAIEDGVTVDQEALRIYRAECAKD